jgi:hypothetical protein
VVALLGSLAITSSAHATAALVTPAAGAVVNTSRPSYSWTLDAGQDTVAIRVSDRSTVNGEGVLDTSASVNYSDSYFPDAADGESLTSYRTPLNEGLPAGTYYWQLQVYDFDQEFLSPVQSFTVPKKTIFRSLVGSARSGVQRVTLKVGHTVNAKYVNYRIEVWRGGRRIGSPFSSRWSNWDTVGSPVTETEVFTPSGFSLKRGETYTAKVRITANGISRNRNVSFTVQR